MNWIQAPVDTGRQAVYFEKAIAWRARPIKVEARATAMGIYNFLIDGQKVGEQVLTPGYTAYQHRVQVQTYDISALLAEGGKVAVEVGCGWAVSPFGYAGVEKIYADQVACAAEFTATFADGTQETIQTACDWDCYTHPALESTLYDGEIFDSTHQPRLLGKAVAAEPRPEVPQVGEWIKPQERLKPIALITTPKGERVLDFGQNMTGWVELNIQGKKGESIAFDHAEILDQEGNFYNENYRTAKAYAKFILNGERQVLAPHFTFYGFRYIRLLEAPETINLGWFTAVVVHSELARTGRFECGHPQINQLYHNVIWGQKGNFLDIPTDCPQRNERLGWTGDAQVFCRTAAINYNVKKFFAKWLGDMALEQQPDGAVFGVVPDAFFKIEYETRKSAAWGDAACICPWEIYQAYGDLELLRTHFPMMKKWVDYIHGAGKEEFLWLDGKHYGDWLAMDAGDGVYVGATPTHMIATAFYAHSCALLIKAGKALGEDVSAYEVLYQKVVAKFRECYIQDGKPTEQGAALRNEYPPDKRPEVIDPDTQTARVLMLQFNLCEEKDRAGLADQLAQMIRANGTHLTTGFVGTPYLLHALSENGYETLAYDLLLQQSYPSWLFSVNQGATTMWEHWDGIKEDGSLWDPEMNSYNHYAYGSVYDWIFGVAAGIKVKEAGYRAITLKPLPDRRLGHLTASIEIAGGRLLSHWEYQGEQVCYRFEIPAGCVAELTLPNGTTKELTAGTYRF